MLQRWFEMAIIDLKQGSKEWLDYRMGKIMATDSSILTETNKWKTSLELWEEKLGLREPQSLNEAMKRGQDLEEEARSLAIQRIGKDFHPCVYESDKYTFLAASLDGMSICCEYLLEIKCPKEQTHLEAIDGVVPSYYLDQIQQQLLVTECKSCFYFSYRPEYKKQIFAYIEIFPDKQRQEKIIEKAQEFYTQMCTMQPPTSWKLKLRA